MKKTLLTTLAAITFGITASSKAQTVYNWDLNGSTAGFGTNPLDGTWDTTNPFWSTSTAGTVATIPWTNDAATATADIAQFRSSNGTVTVSGNINALRVEEAGNANYTLNGGTISIFAANFTSGVRNATANGEGGNTLTVNSNIELADVTTGSTRELIFSTGRAADNGGLVTFGGGISRVATDTDNATLQFRVSSLNGLAKTVLNGAISNGGAGGSVNVEYGNRDRAIAGLEGRVELNNASNSYTGITRIGSGTTVVNVNAPSGAAGAFGTATSQVNIGFGQLSATSAANLLIGAGGLTVARDIQIQQGTGATTAFGVTIGGENTTGVATYSGNIDLSISAGRTTKVSLTAASGGQVDFTNIIRHSDATSAVPIEKIGAGTVNLSRALGNTYTGGTTVSQGTLLVNNTSNSGTGTGSVTVASGAIIGGSGIMSGATTVSGSLRPGNSIGTLNIGNDTTWNSSTGNSWVFELGTSAANLASASSGGSTQDLLNITGNFVKGTGTAFTFDFANTGSDGVYKIVDWTVGTGFVDTDFVANNLAGGRSGTFTVDSGTSALYLTVVPEPSTYGLLLGGLGAIVFLRQRRAM